jgi:tetratricopeptide (TPR) repeat protein
LEIVTVSLDTLGIKAALPYIELAKPDHPSLIDHSHSLSELFGILTVPRGVWIDEQGVIVRPPEKAYTIAYPTIITPLMHRFFAEISLDEVRKDPETMFDKAAKYNAVTLSWVGEVYPTSIVPLLQEKIAERLPLPSNLKFKADPQSIVEEPYKSNYEAEKYLTALCDWVVKGAESRFALTPEEVVRRSRPRPFEESLGAAHFELAQHLYRQGQTELAITHFKEAHRLYPDNWTYKRQAWSMADPYQGPTEVYESDYMREVAKVGAANMYLPLDMD